MPKSAARSDLTKPPQRNGATPEAQASAAPTSRLSALLGPGTISAMLDHIDYVVERIGIDHVGFGSDFNHGGHVEGFADAGDALNVTVALVERGYDEAAIEKIWGGNFLRVWREAEAGATN